MSVPEPIELSGGLRVVAEPVGSVESVSFAVHVATGSRFESGSQVGWSHFIEHLLFRGTPTWSSGELDAEFDAMGGVVDAMTSRESTVLLVKVASEDGPRALDMVCEMVTSPLLEDVEPERAVILEELAMIDDDPSDRLGEAMSRAVFGTDPLGNPVAGTPETVAGASRSGLVAFHRERYVRSAITVAAVGSFDADWFSTSVDDAFDPLAEGHCPVVTREAAPHSSSFHIEHPSEQVHIQLGGIAPGRDSEDRFALRVLDVLLGGSASSRLFTELRERRGLAYDTGSFISPAMGASEWGVYIATRPERAREAAEALGHEVSRFREAKPSESDLNRAKRHLKSRFLLSRESMAERATSLITHVGSGLRPLTPAEILSALDAVTVDAVFSLAQSVLAPDLIHAGSIGPGEGHAAAALAASRSGSLIT